MLAIYESEKYTQEVADFIVEHTNRKMSVREQSLYRALRRFSTMGILNATTVSSKAGGQARKYYSLTCDGAQLLQKFIFLHIEPVQNNKVQKIINSVKKGNHK